MHIVQEKIIELLNKRNLTYSELYRGLKLGSNLFNYHLMKLVNKNFIIKNKNKYKLSSNGQAFFPYLDIEKQPIIAVILLIYKENKIVLIKRNKHAFYGYWALPGGKVNFGETTGDAVKRICLNETGLEAKSSKYIATIQEIVKEQGKEKYHFLLLLYKVKVKSNNSLKDGKLFSLNELPNKIIPSDAMMLKITKEKQLTSILEDKGNKIKQEYFG